MKVPSVRSPAKFFAVTFALSAPIWLAGAIIGDAPAWAPMRLPIIVLLMPAVLFVSYWVMRLTGRPLPEVVVPVLAAPLLFVLFFVAAVGEEGGWTAYATDPLLRRHNVLTTGLLLGLVWASWHVVPLVQAHRSVGWIAWHGSPSSRCG